LGHGLSRIPPMILSLLTLSTTFESQATTFVLVFAWQFICGFRWCRWGSCFRYLSWFLSVAPRSTQRTYFLFSSGKVFYFWCTQSKGPLCLELGTRKFRSFSWTTLSRGCGWTKRCWKSKAKSSRHKLWSKSLALGMNWISGESLGKGGFPRLSKSRLLQRIWKRISARLIFSDWTQYHWLLQPYFLF